MFTIISAKTLIIVDYCNEVIMAKIVINLNLIS